MQIVITNPWTGATVVRDIADLTQRELDAYVEVMDEDACNAIAAKHAPCSPAEFLSAYVDLVGPSAAGVVILGS